ncbi:DNA helicase [Leptolyngbyaceae cyanobacterium CCMR0082]|uniref:DNA 3'-5' helicase n=1 Tax=Adonisia turfae CCMR0082 TaxID=2304604 RepID=A0A6M0S6X4_9CYAN|nr:3'-5' exonuclease [Adonisia turfae]NEZ63572.1 DNA helicase [Adonisia turfae CCMR0082]
MEFRIADTFTDSLNKLTNQEKKSVKTTAFDLQLNPANPGLRFHKLSKTKDDNFWSVSANMDIRIIVHKTAASLMLCYVDHHDDAYAWASKRKIERHPKTGAAQLVEVRERIEEITIQTPVIQPPQQKPLLYGEVPDDDLLAYGVPTDWLDDVRLATEDTLFDIAERLPQEAAEALLELATGGKPTQPTAIPAESDPFTHPDAQRRFRVMSNQEELQRALEYPWEKWTVFLHPAQRHLVERGYNGPARISGSAGTGKTIVALHRAVFLARQHPDAQILLTTFSQALANALNLKLERLVGNEPDICNRIQSGSIRGIARELYETKLGEPNIVETGWLKSKLIDVANQTDNHNFTPTFLWGEWNDVVDAWQLETWEVYRDVQRLGRKTRIGGKQREILWSIFRQLWDILDQRNQITWAGLFRHVTDHLTAADTFPFDYAIVDEAQDLGIAELRFLAKLGTCHPDSLFFTGDLGQRIFQQPYSWKSLGVNIRGRSQTLKINYRTSHQIRQQADRLLPSSIADVDGNFEERRNTVSVFNGPTPEIEICDDADAEIQLVSEWIVDRLAHGIQPDEIGVFVRSEEQMHRAIDAIKQAGANPTELDDQVIPAQGAVAVSTMHLAKGLEFRCVAVIACDDEILPLQERIETISDEADLEEVYNTERHLLYVACTRARDQLLITGVDPASEFLDDLNA